MYQSWVRETLWDGCSQLQRLNGSLGTSPGRENMRTAVYQPLTRELCFPVVAGAVWSQGEHKFLSFFGGLCCWCLLTFSSTVSREFLWEFFCWTQIYLLLHKLAFTPPVFSVYTALLNPLPLDSFIPFCHFSFRALFVFFCVLFFNHFSPACRYTIHGRSFNLNGHVRVGELGG